MAIWIILFTSLLLLVLFLFYVPCSFSFFFFSIGFLMFILAAELLPLTPRSSRQKEAEVPSQNWQARSYGDTTIASACFTNIDVVLRFFQLISSVST